MRRVQLACALLGGAVLAACSPASSEKDRSADDIPAAGIATDAAAEATEAAGGADAAAADASAAPAADAAGAVGDPGARSDPGDPPPDKDG